jgi:serine/threonine protein kinase
MSPESAGGGRSVDTPTDVFAFGILACEMLTGRSPYATPVVFHAMIGEPIPAAVIEFDERIEPALRSALVSCLAQAPTERPSMRAICHVMGRGAVPAT